MRLSYEGYEVKGKPCRVEREMNPLAVACDEVNECAGDMEKNCR